MRKAPLMAVIALAIPAAPARAAPFDVYLGPIRVRSYELDVVATVRQADGPANVDVQLDRDTGKQFPTALGGRRFHQEHSFLVDRGAHVQIANNLESASIRVNMGSYGRI